MEAPNFIESYENLASDDYCQRMIDEWERLEANSSTYRMDGKISNLDSLHRNDISHLFHITSEELASETYDILNQALKKYVDKYPSLGDTDLSSVTIKVQKTNPKGAFHTWHYEQKGLKDALRFLTWTIYLNDVPDGEGETEFLEYGIKIKPKRGLIAIFPASWQHTHRGNTVYNVEKYIATGWWYAQELGSY